MYVSIMSAGLARGLVDSTVNVSNQRICHTIDLDSSDSAMHNIIQLCQKSGGL